MRWVVNEPSTVPPDVSTSWTRTGNTPAGKEAHWPLTGSRWMVKGAAGVAPDEELPTTTGIDRSTPPEASAGSEATGRGEAVDDTGVPSEPVPSDWSKPEMLDRHE